MGITKVFSNEADLSGITEQGPLKLSKVSVSLVAIGHWCMWGTKGHKHLCRLRSLTSALDPLRLECGQVTMEEVASRASGTLGTSSALVALTLWVIFGQGLPFFGPRWTHSYKDRLGLRDVRGLLPLCL